MSSTTVEKIAQGALVQVRGQKWVVGSVDPAPKATLVSLQSVEDGRYGETLEVIWEIEQGAHVLPSGSLPQLTADGFDPPDKLAAFLDAVRWSAVASADVRTLQSPFRSGIAIEDYQLEPVVRAVDAPRVNLLLADDVGLGKTVEAGLVLEELLLRQRARKVLIISPAGLVVKWREEMAEKFGLDFTIIDSQRCAEVRRELGSSANPFRVHPLAIVSLPWLRGPKAQRLLDEVLPTEPSHQRPFDLLVLDEAHHVAPAAPKQVYAVDSQQTKLIRRMAPHFTHRLFLSATPHNGYQASFTALLEILDDQRFARGVEPERNAVRQTVIRRLKHDIVNADGTARFKQRQAREIPVDYPDDERAVHGLLREFARSRQKSSMTRPGRKATDLVTLLLKKRLFSSPAAFLHTVRVFTDTLQARSGRQNHVEDIPEWMEDFLDETATYDDESLANAEDDALGRSRDLQPDPVDAELDLLDRMERWALTHEARPDAKARELLTYLTAVCRPDQHWTTNRVVVFTEYRDTQLWLAGLLRQQGFDARHVAELHGGIDTDDREQIRLTFQKDPTENDLRILLATDAASEGIDLQRHCHRLVNYDIPFNPNKLEQRIGRIDRYGQTENPEILHFVGANWERATDSFEADLEFLSRVATKVARMEEDLGSVNAVLADAVQRRMLGQLGTFDVEGAGSARRGNRLAADGDVSAQVRRVRERLDATVAGLGISPQRVQRVVETALDLAHQQPLVAHVDEKHLAEGLYDVPVLTGSWVRAAAGLTEKLRDENSREEPRRLPVTFDSGSVPGRDDVVLAHLNHPLVAMSTRLLRAAVSNDTVGLHRVTAVVSDDPVLESVFLGAYARYVIVGADGVRLHEEVLHAGGWAPETGRFRRVENLTTIAGILDRALVSGVPASTPLWQQIVERWPRVSDGLLGAIDWRASTRRDSLLRTLEQREEDERTRITSTIDQFAATLRAALAEPEDEGELALFGAEMTTTADERAQYRRDRRGWQERLDALAAERDRELAAIADRYRSQEAHRFPVAVVAVIPRREATR